MPVIRFVTISGELLATVEAHPGVSLLQLALEHQVPLHWRCGQGTCGTCRVRVRHAGQPKPVMLSGKERNVLCRAGLISQQEARQEALTDRPESWRLACHLQLTDDDWTVEVPPPGV
jgi:ferredoxin